jgi:hypothetical protein
MAAAAEGTFGEYRRFLAERARAAAGPPSTEAHEPVVATASSAVQAAGGGRTVARSHDAGGVS